MVRMQETFVPDPDMSQKYAEKYVVYRQLYPTLTSINKGLA
jgi:sugar (pentulose or hexulose) kinase